MIAWLLVLASMGLGCATMVLSVAFHIAHWERRQSTAYGLLNSANGAGPTLATAQWPER